MKRNYQTLEVEIIRFCANDVITASNDGNDLIATDGFGQDNPFSPPAQTGNFI